MVQTGLDPNRNITSFWVFNLPRGCLPNMLSNLCANTTHHLSLLQMVHTPMLLRNECMHLTRDGLHLFIELMEPPHQTSVAMHLSLQ